MQNNKLNATQRNSIGAGEYHPRVRSPNEALPPSINVFAQPVLSPIRMDSQRPGANDFKTIKSLGTQC